MSTGANLEGLDAFTSSALVSSSKEQEVGVLYAEISLFHEDLDNARQYYCEKAINVLVNSFKAINTKTGKPRGILQPLCVKKHPKIKGAFLINGGARRLRAAKIAGLEKIPYFIDDNADDFDKVVDNLHREKLETEDIARFIERQLKSGIKSSDIAKSLGKPASYISDYSAYIKMEEYIKNLMRNKFTSSVQILARLHRANKNHPSEVKVFCEKISSPVTAAQVATFISSLDKQEDLLEETPALTQTSESKSIIIDDKKDVEEMGDQIINEYTSNKSLIKPIITVLTTDGHEAQLLIKQRAKLKHGWIKYYFDGSEEEILLAKLKIISILEQ